MSDIAPEEPAELHDEADDRRSRVRDVLEFIGTLAAAFLIAAVVRTFVVQPFVIPSGSMIPTIQISDQVLVNKFVYRFEPPARGDIVVLDDPRREVPILIKRVIAVGGDTVNVDPEGRLVLNGEVRDEPYTHGLPTRPQTLLLPVKVPEGYLWVMGDNRTNSTDSRTFGPIPVTSVHGRGFLTYWPPNRFGALE